MATEVPAKKNATYIFYTGLAQLADPRLLYTNPTIVAGDVKVSIDGGALNNLGTLPTVVPASSNMVKVTLANTEMNGDNITVVFHQAAQTQWGDLIVEIQTATNQLDDLATTLGTISGHLTADYGAIEKTNIDLLSDGTVGLAALQADIAAVSTAVMAITTRRFIRI